MADFGVANELAVDVTDAARSDRTLKGDARNHQSGRSADHRGDVRVDFRINGNNVNDDLDFVEKSVGKKRTNRTVDEATCEGFFFARTAFTLEESAGELAGCIGLFDVINRKREKVLSGFGFFLRNDRCQNNRIVHLADDGARGLTSNLARCERHVVIAESERFGDFVKHGHRDLFL